MATGCQSLLKRRPFGKANRGAHLRSGQQAAGLTNEPSGEAPCSEARFAPRMG